MYFPSHFFNLRPINRYTQHLYVVSFVLLRG